MRSAFLISLILSSAAESDLFSCPKLPVALNASNPIFFLNYTQLTDNLLCQTIFSFPSQYAAEININGWNMNGDSVKVFSQWAYNTQTLEMPQDSSTSNDSLHVMWPPRDFSLIISTVSPTKMILSINITLKLMSDDEPGHLSTNVNQQPQFIQFRDWKEDSSIAVQSLSSGGQLVVSVASPDSLSTSYANIFIYEGSGEDFLFSGTLLSLLLSDERNYFTSKSDTLTFYRAMDDEVTATLLVNDVKNMMFWSYFYANWSPYNQASQQQKVVLDATSGMSMLTVLNEADGSNAIYLEKVDYNEGEYKSAVILLAGGMIRDYNSTRLGTYRDPKMFDDQNYPQYLPGTARTFILEQGIATVYYSSIAVNDSIAVEGRNGFVMSNNYPFSNEDQNSKDFILNTVDCTPFVFTYTIQDLNCSEGAYINFTLQDMDQTRNDIVDLHNLTTVPVSFNITALSMTMSIVGGKGSSSGTFISYTVNYTHFSDSTIAPFDAIILCQETTTGQPETTSDFTTNPATAGKSTVTSPTTSQTTLSTTTAGTSTPSTSPSPPPPKNPLKIILICVGVVLILALVIVIIIFLRYRIRRGKYRAFWATMSGVLPIAVKVDQWELGDKQLEIFEDKELGKGAFGVVYEGELYGDWPVDRIVRSMQKMTEERDNKVAVKRLPLNADIQARVDFMEEINFMKKLGYHPHVLGMIGCITATSMPVIVLDYCENGDLLSWIRKNKYSPDMTPEQLLSIAWQISDGLCHLKSLNLIHRDLAARNILLTKDIVAKISDFGLCRKPENPENSNTYLPQFYVSRGGRLPVKWLAPESLRDFQFSFKTDLWSYGVILWEMYTFGDVPFGDVNPLNLYEVLENGERLPQGTIPDNMYKLMAGCWDAIPGKRKPIEEIKETLSGMLASTCNYYLTMSADEGDLKQEENDSPVKTKELVKQQDFRSLLIRNSHRLNLFD